MYIVLLVKANVYMRPVKERMLYFCSSTSIFVKEKFESNFASCMAFISDANVYICTQEISCPEM